MADTMLMMARQACNDLRKGRPDLGQSRMATARPGARPAAPQVGVSNQWLRRPGKSAVNSMAAVAAPIQLPQPPPLSAAADEAGNHQPLLIENCRPVAVNGSDVASQGPTPQQQQQQQRPPAALARDELSELTQSRLSLSPSQHQLMEQLHFQQQPQPQLPLMSQPVVQSLATGAAALGAAGRRVGGANVQLCCQLALYLARSASSPATDVHRAAPPAVAVRRFQFDTPSPDERVLAAMASGKQPQSHQSMQHLTTTSSTRSVAASGPLL